MCLGVYLVLSLDILGFPCTTHHSIPLQLLCLHCILILSLSSHVIDTSYLPTISLCNHHIHTHVSQKQAPSCFITQQKKIDIAWVLPLFLFVSLQTPWLTMSNPNSFSWQIITMIPIFSSWVQMEVRVF
jgi:hypothetical protein